MSIMKKNYASINDPCSVSGSKFFSNKKISVSTFICLLFLSFVLQSQNTNTNEQKAISSSPWQLKGLTNEIESKRTRTSKHFMNGEQKITSFTAPGSIHYLAEENNWEDINTSIVANTASNSLTHPYVSLKNSIKTWFPMNPFTNHVIMASKEGDFKEKIKAINLLDANKMIIGSLSLSSQISVTVNNTKIRYSGFCQGLSLEYDLSNDSRKFDLIIHSANFFNALPASVKYLSIEEEFKSDAPNTGFTSQNNAVNVTVNGTIVFNFRAPLAYDANQLEDKQLRGELGYKIIKNGVELHTDFLINWMKNSSRVFPLHLDPTVDYYPQFSTFWTGYQTSSASKTSGYLRITNSTTASWAKFDLSSLPPGCTVTQAVYYGYHYSTTSSAKVCYIRSMGTVEPVSASASVIFNQANNGAAYNSNYTYGGSTYSWNPGALGGTALSDIVAAAGGTFALGFSYNSGSTTFMYHYGVNGNSSNICYLEVDYFTVPCSGTPDSNSVVTPSYAICPGTNVILGLSTTYSVGGIAYQWQSSTTSSVGPFTSISGATTNVIITPTLNTQTWFTTVITCTNAGSPINALSGLVMIQPTTIDSIPYFESFEGILGENKLPNCSWSASNLGSTAMTYTSSNTLGRVPRTGSSFASFYYNPTGFRYFYTNGLQLEVGITYSASIWYKTEYYGYNNWSDLSILIGTAQSPVGLSSIASTNGPAISSIYKSLSDTFSVASSGIYYLCVRGTGGTSSSAQYLSWDDLEVIIPCELNSPNVSIAASSTVVCSGQPVNISASGANSYSWTNGSLGSSINDFPTQSQTYTVVATNTLSGCSVQATQFIHVNPSPEVFIYSDKTTVCSGAPTNISVFGSNASYQWNTGGIGANIIVSPTVATTYTVLATNAQGCSTEATLLIGIYALPNVQVSSIQQDGICAGESATLNASGATTYTWVSNISSVLLGGNSIVVSPLTSVVYSVQGIDANGCSNSSSFSLLVSECTGLATQLTNETDFRLFPNPTKGEVSLNFTSLMDRHMVITDLQGRRLVEFNSNERLVSLNLSEYADGIYFLRVDSQNATETIKILKTH